MRLVEWGILAALIAGCGRYGYDSLGLDDAPRLLGSATCGDGASSIDIDTVVQPGSVVVVQAAVRGDAGDCAVADSQGNTYELLAGPGDDQLRISVFASAIARGVGPGDAIDVTHPVGDSTSVIAVALDGVAGQPGAVLEGGAGGYAVDVPFSEPAAGLSYCAVAVRNAGLEIDSPWIESSYATSVCSPGALGTAHQGSYWIPAGAGASSCGGAITSGAEGWRAVVATFSE